nr:c-type cytochrome [Pseudomonadota bacterium]
LYNSACVLCHGQGVAGAPRIGDKNAWLPRLQQGFDILVQHVIQGFNAMPPKGGAMDASDADITAAVSYMISTVE